MNHCLSVRPKIGILSLVILLLCPLVVSCAKAPSSGYTFLAGSTEIAIDAQADQVLPSLGDPLSDQASPSCGGIQGNDHAYTFRGFRVYTTPGEKGDVICKIELTDDSVSTPEGVCVGMKAEDVSSHMKGSAEKTGENLIYKAGNMKLQILIRDGFVTNIQYVTA